MQVTEQINDYSLEGFLNQIKTKLTDFDQKVNSFGSLYFNSKLPQFIVDEYTITTQNKEGLKYSFSARLIKMLNYVVKIPLFNTLETTQIITLEGIEEKDGAFAEIKEEKELINIYIRKIDDSAFFMTAINADMDKFLVLENIDSIIKELKDVTEHEQYYKVNENSISETPIKYNEKYHLV